MLKTGSEKSVIYRWLRYKRLKPLHRANRETNSVDLSEENDEAYTHFKYSCPPK